MFNPPFSNYNNPLANRWRSKLLILTANRITQITELQHFTN